MSKQEKAEKATAAGKLEMPCPFCDGPARLKRCRVSEGYPETWYWSCQCQCRGFFGEDVFKALDKAKKISLN